METTPRMIEVAVGSVANRGNVIPLHELHNYVKYNTELYRSMFIYDDTFTGNVKTYQGTYDIDEIILDIDIKDENLEPVDEVMNFLNINEIESQFWFSGTGFHVHIPNIFGLKASKDLPEILKHTLDSMFGKLGVDNIYDKSRLIRAEFSFNKKNNTYKIPIYHLYSPHWNYNDYVKLATFVDMESPADDPARDANAFKNWLAYDKGFLKAHNTDKFKDKIVTKPKRNSVSVNTTSNSELTAHVTCVQKMYKQGPELGSRHQTILRMISAWKRSGIPRAGSESLIGHWSPDFDRTEAFKMIDTVYGWEHDGYGCNDTIMDKFCDARCKFYRSKDYGVEVFNADSMTEQFREFVKTDYSDRSFDLGTMYKMTNPYRFTVGELITIIGDTKLGKTAFIQNIVTKANQFKCLYISLEVNEKLMWRRFCQIAFNKTKEEVVNHYLNDDIAFVNEAKEKLGHLKVLTVSPEINNIIDVISSVQPKIIVIDTIDEIRVDYVNDSLLKMQKIISKLKEIAQKHEVIIFAVSHISKTAAYEGTLNRHSAKGDSAIEQKSDKLLGISAPNPGSKARIVESIVARDESGFKLKCFFNHETFRFQQAIL
jgi:archaellum biogenesis ATPase FlaH